MSFEAATDVLAIIGAGACLWLGFTGLKGLSAWTRRSAIGRRQAGAAAAREEVEAVQFATASAPLGVPADHLVAIAAAVAAVSDGLKIVHIADSATGRVWTSEGRWLNQTSHRPH
jgi:hypothetical protein